VHSQKRRRTYYRISLNQGDSILSINVNNFDNKSAYLKAALLSGNGSLESKVESFTNTFTTHALKEKPTLIADVPVIRNEKKLIMNKLLESFILESEARRIGLVNKRVRNDEESFDTLGQCIDIARRILRGEEVADEETALLEEQFPELFFDQATISDDIVDEDRENFLEELELITSNSQNSENYLTVTNASTSIKETTLIDDDTSIDTLA